MIGKKILMKVVEAIREPISRNQPDVKSVYRPLKNSPSWKPYSAKLHGATTYKMPALKNDTTRTLFMVD